MFLNLPNFLTFLRILLIPVFIQVYQYPFEGRFQLAAFIFLLASVTDLLDGYLARRQGQITPLGKLLDPVADKLLIASALILLVAFNHVSTWLAIIIVGREFAVMGLRVIALNEGIVISVETMGKVKMVLQTFGIFFLILSDPATESSVSLLGTVLLWGAALLALISGGQYFYRYWKAVSVRSSS